jgi:hypothetical protein
LRSLIGMIPGTVMFVYVEAGLAATVVITVVLARLAHTWLRRAVPEDTNDADENRT